MFEQLLSKEYQDAEAILELISYLNTDEDCIGIMLQLPLPEHLSPSRNHFLQAIDESKDIDGLGGSLVGKSFSEYLEFTPATPRAVMMLLDYYQLGDLRNKRVAIIGQSVVVGKPLALECLKRGAIVQCCDIRNTPAEIVTACQNAQYVFAGTGAVHLITAAHSNDKKNQIFIDIGYGHLKGKAVGDMDISNLQEQVAHITPVPGGV
ncbi:MAG: bifunctional 5,10-methylenetetrahydrofolate dehydrogenase/5,10-methenyltetrahydrofolate cyclohydrolase [bacterium]|nr:bifunctional 5,10-methylenetetrahydrofolate dehydrogenase/5,10-methenyltetrahydrofolate cyclohydrolase [bacterium]